MMTDQEEEEKWRKALAHLLPPKVDPNRHSWWILYKVMCWGSNVGVTNPEWETICKLRRNTTCKIGFHCWRNLYPAELGNPTYECAYCRKTKGRYVI